MHVINLGDTRNLLADWDLVRRRILQGKIKGWATCIRDDQDEEAIFLGGSHKTDHSEALEASMCLSWAITQASDLERPKFGTTD